MNTYNNEMLKDFIKDLVQFTKKHNEFMKEMCDILKDDLQKKYITYICKGLILERQAKNAFCEITDRPYDFRFEKEIYRLKTDFRESFQGFKVILNKYDKLGYLNICNLIGYNSSYNNFDI